MDHIIVDNNHPIVDCYPEEPEAIQVPEPFGFLFKSRYFSVNQKFLGVEFTVLNTADWSNAGFTEGFFKATVFYHHTLS